MSCDYPCHICNPEEWAEENKPPPYDFDGVYDRANLALGRALHPLFDKADAVLWWVPMEGWPTDVTICEERDVEDVNLLGSRMSTTMIMDQRIYLEREYAAWKSGVERFRVISYMQKVLDWDKGLAYISAVQSQAPPPWGWWMPSLNPAA